MIRTDSTATGSDGEAEKLDTYLQSRTVISNPPVAVLVDAFRFVDKCRARIASRWHDSNASSGGAAATGEAITSVQTVYFLSHFHSDHYTGLSPSQARSCGLVYASRSTAALVVSELNVPPEIVVPLDFGSDYCFSLEDGAFLGETDSPWLASIGDKEAPTSLVSGRSEKGVFYVRLIPANHCPGAAMLLFTSAAFGVVLHTGDFRFNGSEANWRAAVQQGRYFVAAGPTPSSPPTALQVPFYESFIEDDEALRTVAGHVDALYLDNTFCDPAFAFIPQWQATQTLVETLRSMIMQPSPNDAAGDALRCVVLVGSYTIGKERVAFAVQEAFQAYRAGQKQGTTIPIYVSPSKFNMLQKMNFHTDRFASLETVLDDTAVGDAAPTEGAANGSGNASSDMSPSSPSNQAGQAQGRRIMLSIVMVPMGAVRYPTIAPAVGRTPRRARADSLGGEAQGEQQRDRPLLDVGDGLGIDLSRFDRVLAVEPTGWAKKPTSQHVTDETVLLKVPYSEHCSFREMISFVAYVNPRRVVPTVSVENFKQHESFFTDKAPRLASRWGNTQPLTRFFTVRKQVVPSQPLSTCEKVPGSQAVESGHGKDTKVEDRPPEPKANNPFELSRGTAATTATAVRRRGEATGAGAAAASATSSNGTPLLKDFFARSALSGSVLSKRQRSPSEDACVVVVGVTPAVIEISDDDESV